MTASAFSFHLNMSFSASYGSCFYPIKLVLLTSFEAVTDFSGFYKAKRSAIESVATVSKVSAPAAWPGP